MATRLLSPLKSACNRNCSRRQEKKGGFLLQKRQPKILGPPTLAAALAVEMQGCKQEKPPLLTCTCDAGFQERECQV